MEKMKAKSVASLSIIVNIFLAGIKLLAGVFFASITLIADGMHSVFDILSSGITYLALKETEKPADEDHNYGHQKFEGLASFAIVIILVISALFILIEAVQSLFTGANPNIGPLAFLVVIFSFIINSVLAKIKFIIGKRESDALIADAKHSRADAFSSLALVGGLFLIKHFPAADSLLAISVSLFIFYESYLLGKKSISPLVDESNSELENKIKIILDKKKISFSEIKTRTTGRSNFAEIELEFSPEEPLKEALIIKENIEKDLMKIDELESLTIKIKGDKKVTLK